MLNCTPWVFKNSLWNDRHSTERVT